MSTLDLVYWLTYAAVAVALIWGGRLYLRKLRWTHRAADLAWERADRTREDFFWHHDRLDDYRLAVRIRIRRFGGDLAASLAAAAQVDASRDDVLEVLWAEDFPPPSLDGRPALSLVENVST